MSRPAASNHSLSSRRPKKHHALRRPRSDPRRPAKQKTITGYGRLVVTSSNLAGEEFALSRPVVTIGRTYDNDLIVKHRSVSRVHARVARDRRTGRYTIRDLHSTNGVRVNGKPYGKVSLDAGDFVDLGHVRFRFVEPGEDFLFARDVKITIVPASEPTSPRPKRATKAKRITTKKSATNKTATKKTATKSRR